VTLPAVAPATELAYRHCEEIVHREARNFSYGIRLLRPPERHALSAVYAMARRIDDIGDGGGPAATRLAALAEVRATLPGATSAGSEAASMPADLVRIALGDATARYGLPMAAFDDLIDGCVADVEGRVYVEPDETIVYCRRVAGSIGRLSLAVFLGPVGSARHPVQGVPAGLEALADDLGVALQLTNILRDITEDRLLGRAYLPRRAAVAAGCSEDLEGPPEALRELMLTYCAEAERWFERGLGLLTHLDGRSRACVGAMAGIYHRLLNRIRRDPLAVTRGRLSLPAWEKAWVAVISMSGGRP